MKSFDLILSIVSTKWPSSKDFWDAWSIQWLATMSLVCQITLAILGSRRRYETSLFIAFVILAAYLLSSYFATIALGKLTVVQIKNPDQPDYITELKGLLAPLILMQLGNPDSIISYSVEENRLSGRQMLNLFIRVIFVVWILIRCWDSSSPVRFLYFPLSVAGFIRSAVTVWALAYAFWKKSSILAEDVLDEENLGEFFNKPNRLTWSMEQKIILKAYHRFNCLKPHIVNWLYHPVSLEESRITIKYDSAFITTEVELGFMYDVLYTKHPILFKETGLFCRFFSFFCLVSALCGFAIIFKRTFFIDQYITYTYALLIGVTALEGYQIVLQPFSAWAIVMMSRHQRNCPMLTRQLNSLAERYMKRKRWSNSVGQLDLLDHRLYDELSWPIGGILKLLGKKEVAWRGHWILLRQEIPGSLKELLVENIVKFNAIRRQKPFTERGSWTLEAHELSSDVEWTQEALEVLKKSISKAFDQSIIIWHMATNICLHSEPDGSSNHKGSKLLSNYMTYLLALQPSTLSLTTANVTLEHACAILKPFLRYRDRNEALGTLSSEEDVLEPSPDQVGTIITRDWHVLSESQKLAATLKGKNNKWQIISSIWAEMLCYAAYNCHVYHHEKLLRQGGELITHVWLLLMHHTDKYTYTPKAKPTEETKGKLQSEL
ncbi:hypothetical protein BT93_L3345 [Corymbia citriodora subsp. variegata]|uniref:DUF4220 domain-containing protein n=1 Tax=Corymbia citriodora subsp. variegata TaxID=360336 RepID=A0A8T0CM57_CORYI|nr:hypothetical protein BT93_L3345 [Corymbia citriodora subsp. variegata]